MALFSEGLVWKKYILASLYVVYETQASSKTIGFPSRKMSVDSNYQTPDSPDKNPDLPTCWSFYRKNKKEPLCLLEYC